MKKILLFILLFSSLGFGEGARFTTQVQDTFGRKISFPTVRFCSEPATGIVCTPLAAGLFSDRALGQPVTNPFTGDINGNVAFYVAPGRYHAQVSGNGIVSFDVPDIVLSDPSLPYAGFVSVVPSTAPANQFATGVSGAGAILYAQPSAANLSNGVTGSGAVVLAASPVFTTSALFPDGTASVPSIAFNAQPTTGFLRPASGLIQGTFAGTVGAVQTATQFALPSGGIIQWSSGLNPASLCCDTGLSRDSAGVIDVGNGTQGDKSGRINAATIGVGSGGVSALSGNATSNETITIGRTGTDATFAIPGNAGLFAVNANQGDLIIRNETAGNQVLIGPLPASGILPVGVTSAGLKMFGATSGSNTIAVPAVAGSNTWTIPAATDTAVGKATTDTLTNKTISSPIDGITCVSVCIPILVQHLTLSGQTGAIVTTTLFSTGNGTGGTPGTGVYRVTVDLFMTTVGTGGNFQPAIRWNNGAANQTCSQSTVSTTSLTGSELASGNGAVCTFTASASINITYEVNANAVTGTPAYTLALRVEYLGT